MTKRGPQGLRSTPQSTLARVQRVARETGCADVQLVRPFGWQREAFVGFLRANEARGFWTYEIRVNARGVDVATLQVSPALLAKKVPRR